MKDMFFGALVLLLVLSFGTSVKAAPVAVTLADFTVGSTGGSESADSITGVLTGSYDTVTGVVTMDAGITTFSFLTVTLGPVYDQVQSNWSTGAGGYAADAFSCVEGTAGAALSLSFCGGYEFGTNNIDESSVDYSTIPGTLNLGGDDMLEAQLPGTVQGSWYLMDTATLTGSTLVMESAAWTVNPGLAGSQLTFSVVPVPAAVWLFGSALGLLGWLRRKTV